MGKEDKKRYKLDLDSEGNWKYNEEEDTSIFALLIWGLIVAGVLSGMFWLLS